MASLRLAVSYTLRSLRRGGQRTTLAVFCIAVGVMAVVALRLAGDMIALSLTSNVRNVIGGDLSVQSNQVPLTRADLGVFDQLRSQGRISDYAPLGAYRASAHRQGDTLSNQLQLYVVDDPNHFPLTGSAAVDDPAGSTYAQVVDTPGSILLSRFASEQLAARHGDTLVVGFARGGAGGELKVGGVLPRLITAGNPIYGYMSKATYARLAGTGNTAADQFGLVDVLVPGGDAEAAAVADTLRQALPTAEIQTVKDALTQAQQSAQYISQTLEVTGLLALLIGGIGVANTMQVSLRRRRTEIAMLKTAGYRRRELITLFGLEAVVLGLAGGVVGSLGGIGIGYLVKTLVERTFFITVAFHVSVLAVASGLLVGTVTAGIFALLPIIRAAAVRPIAVLRDESTMPTVISAGQTGLLYGLLVVLFAGLAATLVGDVVVASIVVVAGLVLLGLLVGVFALVVWLVGLVPVPERPGLRWAAGSLVALSVAVISGLLLGVAGWVMTGLAAANLALVVMPRSVKTAAKLALRSLRRTRVRTATTLVALFCGVGAIGIILVLGQDVSGRIQDTLASLSGYDVYAIASPQDASRLLDQSARLPGLQSRRTQLDIATAPVTLDDRTTAQIAAALPPDRRTGDEGGLRVGALAGVEGYDLAGGQVPDVGLVLPGRPLSPSDATTHSVLVRTDLRRAPYNLNVGSTIVLKQATSGKQVTLTVKGFYSPARIGSGRIRIIVLIQPIVADVSVIRELAGSTTNPDLQTTVALQIDAGQREAALRQLEGALPRVYVFDVADIAAVAQQIIGNLVVLLVALASLSVLAGLVIIANTVALAMLERRREIGILKAVGHDRRSVLAQVLVENALVGVMGSMAGMLAVSAAARLLQDQLIHIDLPVSATVVLTCAGGLVGLVVVTAAAVAWGPTRARPVEVLRYE